MAFSKQRRCAFWLGLALVLALLGPRLGRSEPLGPEPNPPLDPWELGFEALDRGEWTAAIEFFSELSREEPGNAALHYYLGVAWVSSGDDLSGVEAFADAADLDPTLRWVQADMGMSLYRLGELDLAEEHLLEALLQGPDEADVLLSLGLIDITHGFSERGNRLIEESVALDPTIAALAFFEAAGVALDRDDFTAATAYLERGALAKGPEEWRAASAELLASLSETKVASRRIRLRAAIGFENDDNLTVSEQDISTGVGDISGTFEADIEVVVVRNEALVVSVGYDFFQSVHQDLEAFNLQINEPHVQISGFMDFLQPVITYAYRSESYRDLDYLDSNIIDLDLALCHWKYTCALFGAGYERRDFAPTPFAPQRVANRYSLFVGQQTRFWDGKLDFSLSWEPQWQNSDQAFLSYDAQIANIGLTAMLDPFYKGLLLGASYGFESRDYAKTGDGSEFQRKDDRHIVWTGIRIPLIGPTQISFDYLLILSRSSITALNYNENIVSLKLWAWH
ncbi:MAG: tetratricopeptide repeat protein [Myxococcota bacterium]|nr:tetratricopeptide repeat protein [Myxococcota bacterium]